MKRYSLHAAFAGATLCLFAPSICGPALDTSTSSPEASAWTAAAAASKKKKPSKTVAKRRPRTRRVVRKVVATAYCLGPCRRCETQGLTCLGTRGRRGIAVARRGRTQAVPLGSRVHVPGYGWAKVDDVGGKVGPKQLDLRFRSHRSAKEWGKRLVRVVAEVPSGG